MTILVVSTDYMVAPAFCDSNMIDSCVDGLIAIKGDVEARREGVFVESDAINSLEDRGLFPYTEIVRANVKRAGVATFYTPDDVTRVVNEILMACADGESDLPLYLIEWSEKNVESNLIGYTNCRVNGLVELVEQVGINSIAMDRTACILHSPVLAGQVRVGVSGTIGQVYPELRQGFPVEIDRQVEIVDTYERFSECLNAGDLYYDAVDDNSIAAAIRHGVRFRCAQKCTQIPNIVLGDGFVDSLRAHQCEPRGRYGAATFDIICRTLSDRISRTARPFYSDLYSKKQLTRAGSSAWRAHITEGNPALRLMLWADGGNYVLANVGNKKDLLIF